MPLDPLDALSLGFEAEGGGGGAVLAFRRLRMSLSPDDVARYTPEWTGADILNVEAESSPPAGDVAIYLRALLEAQAAGS